MSIKRFLMGVTIAILIILALHPPWGNRTSGQGEGASVFTPSKPEPTYVVDQCARADLYKACLQTIQPSNPNVASSQWDDVKVRGCTTSSAKLAIRLSSGVEEKCAIPIPPNLDNY